MNTYNIEVRGTKIFENISQQEMQNTLKTIRGIVWTTGGSDRDITVSLNKDEHHCNE